MNSNSLEAVAERNRKQKEIQNEERNKRNSNVLVQYRINKRRPSGNGGGSGASPAAIPTSSNVPAAPVTPGPVVDPGLECSVTSLEHYRPISKLRSLWKKARETGGKSGDVQPSSPA